MTHSGRSFLCLVIVAVAVISADGLSPAIALQANDPRDKIENSPAKPADNDDTIAGPRLDRAGQKIERDAIIAPPGNPVRGRKVYRRCASCHSLQPAKQKRGPSLYGIVGRMAGTQTGYDYSDALLAANIIWDADALFAFLENPEEYVPENAMRYRGLKNAQDRIDLIAYLASTGPHALQEERQALQEETQTDDR